MEVMPYRRTPSTRVVLSVMLIEIFIFALWNDRYKFELAISKISKRFWRSDCCDRWLWDRLADWR